jgi:hypothetical protein
MLFRDCGPVFANAVPRAEAAAAYDFPGAIRSPTLGRNVHTALSFRKWRTLS